MRRRIGEAVLGLVVGGGLFVWALRDFPWEGLLMVPRTWFWLVAGGMIMTVAHVLRAWRWQLMLRASGVTSDGVAPWWALMVGYLANLVLPRVGELLRCTLLWRWRRIPVAISLGSVVAERLIDVGVLGILAISVVAVEGLGWLDLLHLKAYLPYILGGIGIAGLVLWLLWRFWLQKRSEAWLKQLISGFFSAASVRPRGLMVGLSFGIWVGYWGAIVGVMLAYQRAGEEMLLSSILWAGWVLLVGSGLAMALPVPGGIGTFHAIGLLLLLSVGWQKPLAQLTVVAAHALQTLLVIVLGGMGVVYGLSSGQRRV
ncbi:MAG: flippase-like domain-containing protein [Bacteroidia bacterium]|nr:flippase-like domain-containing protein [Bacteroidia bacterium]